MADENKDYYDLLKHENYTTLLDREIQLDNARQRALKMSNNALAANGFASTGYGQSQRLGIEGQYLQGLQNAEQNYQTQQNDIAQQQFQYNEAQTDKLRAQQGSGYNDLLSTLSSDAVNSQDRMNQALSGYGLLGEDGKLNYGKAVEMFGEDYARNLQTNLALKESQYAEQAKLAEQENSAQSLQELQNMTFVLNGDGAGSGDKSHVEGRAGTLGQWYGQEIEVLMSKAQNNQLEEGCVVKMKNGRNDEIYLKWNGVGFVQVNSEAYKSATKKHTLTHNNGKNYWDTNP